MTAARKLAAILAADVVGYSRMMGEDEAGTASLVRERREAAQPIIASHGGRLFKTMGDGMFVEFPSVVAAVECALAIQSQTAARNNGGLEAKRVLYRIGVHLGDVLVEGEDILGDGVNIASRLEGVAEPGSVSISGAVHGKCAGGSTEFIDLGEKGTVNIARPVRACRRIDADPLTHWLKRLPKLARLAPSSCASLRHTRDRSRLFRRWGHGEPTTDLSRSRLILSIAEHGVHLSRQGPRCHEIGRGERPLCARRSVNGR